jgi:hypothetical protein
MTADSYRSLEGELIIEECVSAFDEESKEEEDDEEKESVLTHRQALQVFSQLLTYASIHDIQDLKLQDIKSYSRSSILQELKHTSIRSFFHNVV